jgi:hypothetical protein
MKQHNISAVSVYFYWFQEKVISNDQIKLLELRHQSSPTKKSEKKKRLKVPMILDGHRVHRCDEHQNPFCVDTIPADLSISYSVEEFFLIYEMN